MKQKVHERKSEVHTHDTNDNAGSWNPKQIFRELELSKKKL